MYDEQMINQMLAKESMSQEKAPPKKGKKKLKPKKKGKSGPCKVKAMPM